MSAKVCTVCLVEKPFVAFGKYKYGKHGLKPNCKECRKLETAIASESRRAYYAQRYIARLDENRAARRLYYHSHVDKEKARVAANARYNANPKPYLERARHYRLQNKPKFVAWNAKIYAAKRKATVAYANVFFIEEAYDLAARRSSATGIKWNVDHIVPMQSKIVCGLHVEHNLAVIPARLNVQKGNRRWPDMP